MGLRRLLAAAGLDPGRDQIEIGPVPGAIGSSINFGLTAAEALAAGKIDGFWANGMATEIAVTTGIGSIVLDVRRGDGPPGCFDYTMPVLATTERLIDRSPRNCRGGGARVGRGAECIETGRVAGHRSRPQAVSGARGGADRRDRRCDLPFYDAAIGEASVAAVNAFARDMACSPPMCRMIGSSRPSSAISGQGTDETTSRERRLCGTISASTGAVIAPHRHGRA